MSMKRIITLLLCVSLFAGILPIEAYATNSTIQNETVDSNLEQTNSLGQINGYLAGNALATRNFFNERLFSQPGGHGFAAEYGNNLIDRLTGVNASVVGGDNTANGAERKIINRDGSITLIQDKYYSSASESVSAAFDDITGEYRYMDGNKN